MSKNLIEDRVRYKLRDLTNASYIKLNLNLGFKALTENYADLVMRPEYTDEGLAAIMYASIDMLRNIIDLNHSLDLPLQQAWDAACKAQENQVEQQTCPMCYGSGLDWIGVNDVEQALSVCYKCNGAGILYSISATQIAPDYLKLIRQYRAKNAEEL